MSDRAVDPRQDETTRSNLIILDALHELETNLRGEISSSRQEIVERVLDLQNEIAEIKTEQQQLHQRLRDSEENQKVCDAILNLERVFSPQSQAVSQPQRPPSESSIPSQQPYQKREKNVLKRVDPNTGKNILEDVVEGTATRQTPPQSGSSNARTTPVSSAMPPKVPSPSQYQRSSVTPPNSQMMNTPPQNIAHVQPPGGPAQFVVHTGPPVIPQGYKAPAQQQPHIQMSQYSIPSRGQTPPYREDLQSTNYQQNYIQPTFLHGPIQPNLPHDINKLAMQQQAQRLPPAGSGQSQIMYSQPRPQNPQSMQNTFYGQPQGNMRAVFFPQSQAMPQPQRPPSASSIPSQQPYQKREKNVMKIVDPNTGNNMLEDVVGGNATRQTPPQSGSSNARTTPVSSATTPAQGSEVGAQFAARVAACLNTAAPRYPRQSPNNQPMPTQMRMQMAPQHVQFTRKPEGPVEGMTTVQNKKADVDIKPVVAAEVEAPVSKPVAPDVESPVVVVEPPESIMTSSEEKDGKIEMDNRVVEENEKNEVKSNEKTVETNNVEETPTPKPAPELKYNYKEDQWSPVNPEGKKQYDRAFLLTLQYSNESTVKPDGLPNLPDVILSEPHSRDTRRSFDSSYQEPRGSSFDFTPGYVRPSPRNRWVPRRDENNPKTIDQIHKEAREAEAKAAYLQSLSNQPMPRGGRGGRDRDRGGRPQGMANVGEDGLDTVAVKAPRTTIDPNRLRLSTQQNVDDNIHIGPSRNFSAWGRGSSAGGTKSQEGERPSTPGSRSHTMSGSTPPSRVHDPRSRDFRQEVKATPPANNLSEAEIEKKTKAIVDEFLNIHDTKKALSCIEELVTPSNLSRFVGALLSYVIQRSKEARKQTATLLHDAVKKKIITVDLYISGLNQVLEFSEDMEYLEPMVYDGCVPLNFLKQACDCLKANKRAGILLSELLHELSNKMGYQKVTELWRSSRLLWTDFLPVSDVLQFIKDKKLEFVLEDEPPKSPGLSAEHINMELEKLIITKDSDNEEVFDWIERNVEPEVTQSPRFIRSLMTIVCRSAITGQSFLKVDEDVIKKRDNLLQKYLDHNGERELQALYALQALAKKLEYPQGLLMSFFGVLYDESIISEDALRKWERSKDPAEQDGKGAALKQVVQFLMFVKEENSGGEATADS